MNDFGRREFLQGNLAAALSTLLTGTATGAALGLAPGSVPGSAFGPAAARAADADMQWGGSLYTEPYTLNASSSMSQDYFLTDDVVVDPDHDLIAAYQQPDGTVAAIVISGGVASQLAPDPTSSSGWAYTDLPALDVADLSTASGLAVGTGSDGNVYGMVLFGTEDKTQYGSPLAVWFWWTPKLGWYWPGLMEADFPATLTNLQASVAVDGQVYFTAWDDQDMLRLWAPQIRYDPITSNAFINSGLSQMHTVWSGSSDPDASCGVVGIVDQDRVMFFAPQAGSGIDTTWGQWGETQLPVDGVFWAGESTTGFGPDVYVETTNGDVGLFLGMQDGIGGGTFGDTTALYPWGPTGQTSVIGLSGGDVKVMTGLPEGTLAPVITIEQNVRALYGVSVTPTNLAVFAVENETNALSVLAKDPTLGIWSRIPVRQPSTRALDVSCWRTQFNLLDANGVAVTATTVKIKPDREISMWQPGGSLTATPQNPLTATTDDHGRFTVAIPVLELDAPQFTVTVASPDGTTQDFAVAPDGEVHAYLGGTGSLIGQPALSADTLLNTKGADGQPLSPTLSNISDPGQRSDSAKAVASTITNCIKLGTGAAPTGTQSFSLTLSPDAPPAYSESSDPAAFTHLLPSAASPAGSAWDDLKKDVHAIEHAIRRAVTKVTAVVANFVSEAEGWVINLTLDIGAVAQFAVNSLRSAITAIHGILHAIEVDVDKAVQWLRMVIDDLLGETGDNASVLEEMIRAAIPAGAAQLATGLDNIADQYFTGLADTVNAELDTLATAYGGDSLASATGAPPEDASTSVQGPPPTLGANGYDPATSATDVKHNWLMDKIKAEFDELLQGDDGFSDDATTAITAFIGLLGDLKKLADDTVTALWDALKDMLAPASAKGMAFSRMIAAVRQLVPDGLQLADDTVHAVADIFTVVADTVADLLDTPIVGLPLLSTVLSKLGIADDLTVGRVFTLIVAFPATLMNRIIFPGSQPMTPPRLSTVTIPASAAPPAAATLGDIQNPLVTSDDGVDWAKFMVMTHAAIRVIHSFADVGVDIYMLAASDATVKPLKFTTWLDTILSFVNVLDTYPGRTRDDGTTPRPMTTPIPYTSVTDRLALAKYITSGLGPGIGLVLLAARGLKDAPAFGSWVPFANTATFATTIALGISVEARNDKDDAPTKALKISETILELSPRALAPLATKNINSATDSAAIAVKLVIDLIQVVSAGLLIAEFAE